MVADNWKFWVGEVGTIKIWCVINGRWKKMSFSQVLYVLELKKNLFIVGQAVDHGFVTTCMQEGCHLTSHDGHGKIVLIRVQTCKLYELQLEVEIPTSHANIILFEERPTLTQIKRGVVVEMPNAKAKSLEVWHERFGHINLAMFLQMLKNDAVVGLQLFTKNLPSRVCEGCAMGKNHRHIFPTWILVLHVKKPT